MPNTAQIFSSPAKLNLFLEVKGRRDDGFHELETVMVRTNFCDQIQVSVDSHSDVRLTVTGDPELAVRVPTDESNLILRAATAFRNATGLDTGWDIQLAKLIPMEAGLAGGSSNAATILLALNQLASRPLMKNQLHELAASLGSDINFFVEDCEAAVCTGRGEQVASFSPAATFYFVVARPAAGNATPAVFGQLQPMSDRVSSENVVAALKAGSFGQLENSIFNRLTEPASQLNAEMADLLLQMESVCGRPAAMSGSGSTCFVCCKNQADADAMLCKVQVLNPAFAMVVRTA